jgi:hypothetical protein
MRIIFFRRPPMSAPHTRLHQALATHALGELKRSVVAGGLAGVFSAVALARRARKGAPSENAPAASHTAAPVDAPRHAIGGALVHHASAIFCGLLFEQVWQRVSGRPPSGAPIRLSTLAAGAIGLTAATELVDTKILARRPGATLPQSHPLEGPGEGAGRAWVYASLALGVAAGAALVARQRHR